MQIWSPEFPVVFLSFLFLFLLISLLESLENSKLQKPSLKGERKSQRTYLTWEGHSLCAGEELQPLAEPKDCWVIISWTTSPRISRQPLSPPAKRKRRREGRKDGGRQKEEIMLSLQDGIWNKVEIQNKYWTTCKLHFPGTFLLAFFVCLL